MMPLRSGGFVSTLRCAMLRDDLIPSEERIFARIEEVFAQGVRRPGYPADRWAEQYCEDRFRTLGLERVRAEPVELPYWEPKRAALTVRTSDGATIDVPCFPLPHAAPTAGLEAELVELRDDKPAAVAGKIALCDVRLARLPYDVLARRATWCFDPDGTFAGQAQVLPFGRGAQAVMEPAIEAGAVAFVGTLTDYPSGSRNYYVPYDAVERPIPGVWISGSDGARLRALLARGAVSARLVVESERRSITCYNIVGELPGADEELERVVLELHLEHAANECVESPDGTLTPTGQPEARWWFTTQIAPLEDAMRNALEAEDLRRSFILPPNVFGPHPTTDGGPFHTAGVPLVNFLTAPFYLFDEQDTLDKIHRPSLVPVTRAAIRLVGATAAWSAAELRSASATAADQAEA